MRKNLKRMALLLLIAVVLIPMAVMTALASGNENLAQGKTATASSSYPGKPWTPDKAVDGDTSGSDSRWSSKRATGTTNEGDGDVGTKEQWLQIDLGTVTPVEQVNIYWEAAFATSYEIQTSLDGEEFQTVKECTATEAGAQSYRDLGVEEAQYIRINCLEPKTAKYGYSIYEVEVFAENKMESAQDVLDALKGQAPTLSEDGTSLVLPEVPAGYEIALYGSDNQQVVRLDGTIIQPLVDMKVNLLYKVTNTTDPEDVATSDADIAITIPGQYTQEAKDNAVPNVMPGLREWKGGSGEFTLTDTSRILVSDPSMDEVAAVIATYFSDMLGREVPVVSGTAPQAGDVYLKVGGSVDELGEEGYVLDIGDYVTITSPTATGMTYGGTSITQILYQDEGMDNAPKGVARDYPKYEVRAGMIDVGRMYIPLEYLEEMTIYMSWFKMNEVHIHINDYWSGSGYSDFRLESEVYPQINAEDGYYTKDEYRQYQKDVQKYGIDVITEIDTPYHAECFRDVPGVQMLKTGYLDITTEEARLANQEIIENLIDEYLDGEDPVIQSDKFHIGTDEYDKKYSEQMRAWTDHFINYVNDKGYETRVWASLGKNGFNGTTPVSNEATMNLWAPYWADVHETYDAGYDVINTYGGWLYIVPGANAGYPDRLNLERLYTEFEVNNFKSGRNPSGEAIMPVAHPQTKGAEFCVWNDMTSFKGGFSWFDIYDRFKAAVALVSEKTWFGEDQEGQTYEQFVARMDALDDKVPNANPGRIVDSQTEQVAALHFTQDGTDSTANGYDATLHGMTVQNGVAQFTSEDYLSMPFDSIGYPYTVSVRVNLSQMDETTALFSGEDGTVYANIDNSGKVGFKRGAYRFSFDYELPLNEWVTLTFVGDAKHTTLYVNGVSKGTAKLMDSTIGGKPQYSDTSIMTFEKVMVNAVGSMDELLVYNYAMSEEEIQDALNLAKRDNLALNKDVTVSGLEVNDGRFTADKAVDGIVSKDSRVSFAKNQDEQWMVVDLGEVYNISELVIQYESQVPKYKIEVSTDGETYTQVYSFQDDSLAQGGASGVHTITLDQPVDAQYVKYTQLQRWKHSSNGNYYSGSIYEFEVYQATNAELKAYTQAALDTFAQYQPGTHNGNVDETFYTSAVETLEGYLALANGDAISVGDLMMYKQMVLDLQDELSQHILVVPQDAVDAYEAAKALNPDDYTAESYEKFLEALEQVSLDNLTTVEEVDAAIQAVADARALLVEANTDAIRTLLQKTYDYAVTLSTDGVTESAAAYFEKVLAEAEAVLADPDATWTELNTAWDNLLEGIAGLGLTQGDKTMLELVITRGDEMMSNADKYVDTHWQDLVDALATAKQVLNDGDAMQEEVDEATQALLNAILAQRYKADKSILEDLINQAEGINLDGYTADSVAVFRAALAEAQAVMADETLSEDNQATVDAAVAALNVAMDGLTAEGAPETTDKPQPSNNPETTDKPEATEKPENVPQTGDSHNVTILMIVMLSSAVCAGAVMLAAHKRKSR